MNIKGSFISTYVCLHAPHTTGTDTGMVHMCPNNSVHDRNLRVLRTANLDWSFMCPGPLAPETGSQVPVRVITEVGLAPAGLKYNICLLLK